MRREKFQPPLKAIYKAEIWGLSVFWFTVPARETPYSITFFSQSFDGYAETYLWVFRSDESLIDSITNNDVAQFSLTLSLTDESIIIALGIDCSIVEASLMVEFQDVQDIFVTIEDVKEYLSERITAAFEESVNLIGDVESKLDHIETSIIDEIHTTEENLENAIFEEIRNTESQLLTRFDDVNEKLLDIVADIAESESNVIDSIATLSADIGIQFSNLSEM